MSDIFISYAQEDRDTTQRLAKALEEQGWSVWWDTRLRAGEVWDEVIERELDAARCVIVLWSKISVQSHWVREEARKGLERRILVPIRIENVELPLPFGGIQTGDLISWKGHRGHPGFEKLMTDVTHIIGLPPQDPASPTPNKGATDRRIVNFLKNVWPKWLVHSVAEIKGYLATIARWRPRKQHLAIAGGIALLVLLGVGISLYPQPLPKLPQPRPTPEEPPEPACYDQDAVNSLINRLRMLGEAYKKNLISITVFYENQGIIVNELNQEALGGPIPEDCLYEMLRIFHSIYQRDLMDIVSWNDSKRKILNILHDVFTTKYQTYEEIENSLRVVRELYENGAIDVVEFNETSEILSKKLIQKIEQSQ